jgi:hypothetical protein
MIGSPQPRNRDLGLRVWLCVFPVRSSLRLILFIAVIALGVDALFHNGAYTQSAFKQASILTEQLRDRLDGTPRTGGDRETATTTTHL